MVNNLTSGCKNCMRLLRILVKMGLEENFGVFVRYIKSEDNGCADALSRGDLTRFVHISKSLGIKIDSISERLPEEI